MTLMMSLPTRRLASLAFLACAVLTATLAPRQALAQPSDRDQVLAAIDTFLVGLRTKDTTIMNRFVDSTTRMTLLRPTQAGGTRVVVMTGPQFIANVTTPAGPFLDEPIRNPVVQVDGDLASVWAEYQVRIDGRVSHCGFDAFHMVRRNGRWMILTVADTFRRTGCGDMWP